MPYPCRDPQLSNNARGQDEHWFAKELSRVTVDIHVLVFTVDDWISVFTVVLDPVETTKSSKTFWEYRYKLTYNLLL